MMQIDLQYPMPNGTLLQVNAQISAGNRLAVFGPSGAGKTTLLRILAGLEAGSAGSVQVKNETWQDAHQGLFLNSRTRSVGMVFQDLALFPNMKVEDQLAFALQKGQSPAQVAKMLQLVELTDKRNLYPAALSGGEKQRLALARALIQEPEVLLLDEPFSGLDQSLKRRLLQSVDEILNAFNCTVILVSHDASEVMYLCDQVLPLTNGLGGKVQQVKDFFTKDALEGIVLENTGKEIWVMLGEQLVKIPSGENPKAEKGSRISLEGKL
ncbi:ATP-binding cassette domain-containing protein [Persicobacter diffluens]|uniref:GTPase n=1 Tax=Persicobacter diffluens TaxID=981 RepID=A0AAN4W197_9BACT|nr:GTPase [Persicobacter diffluens]